MIVFMIACAGLKNDPTAGKADNLKIFLIASLLVIYFKLEGSSSGSTTTGASCRVGGEADSLGAFDRELSRPPKVGAESGLGFINY